jgi:hypothetical protein
LEKLKLLESESFQEPEQLEFGREKQEQLEFEREKLGWALREVTPERQEHESA